MKLEFWTVSGAPSPWRVALGMAFKGLDYDIHLLSAAGKERAQVGTIPRTQSAWHGADPKRHQSNTWTFRRDPRLVGSFISHTTFVWQNAAGGRANLATHNGCL